MPIGYDHETGGIAFISDECPDCESTMYSTGCDRAGCDSMYCPDCSYGCDLDALGEDGACCAAMAEEDPADRSERVNAERAVFGLSPIAGQPRMEQAEPDEKRPFTMDDYREQL